MLGDTYAGCLTWSNCRAFVCRSKKTSSGSGPRCHFAPLTMRENLTTHSRNMSSKGTFLVLSLHCLSMFDRHFCLMHHSSAGRVVMVDGKETLNFASSNFLGLANNEVVKVCVHWLTGLDCSDSASGCTDTGIYLLSASIHSIAPSFVLYLLWSLILSLLLCLRTLVVAPFRSTVWALAALAVSTELSVCRMRFLCFCLLAFSLSLTHAL